MYNPPAAHAEAQAPAPRVQPHEASAQSPRNSSRKKSHAKAQRRGEEAAVPGSPAPWRLGVRILMSAWRSSVEGGVPDIRRVVAPGDMPAARSFTIQQRQP